MCLGSSLFPSFIQGTLPFIKHSLCFPGIVLKEGREGKERRANTLLNPAAPGPPQEGCKLTTDSLGGTISIPRMEKTIV